MADAANAVGNAAEYVFDEVVLVVLMCWVHVWRAVKAKHHLLRNNTEEQQKELYTDMNYIHNIAIQELVPIAMLKFTTKWVVTKNEPEMAEYIKKT